MLRKWCFFILLISVIIFIGCDLQGTVKNGDTRMEGVIVTLQGDKLTQTTQTDENGKYSFKNIPAGTYTIIPEKEGCLFTPKDQYVIYPVMSQWINFKLLDSLIESISVMTPCGSNVVKTGGKMRIMAVATYKSGKEEIATDLIHWESLDTDIAHIKDNALFTKFAVADHPGCATIVGGTDDIKDTLEIEVTDQFFRASDQVIPGITPPESYPSTVDGVCIDTCLWAMIHANGFDVTMAEVNKTGKLHLPGFGLTVMEITPVLNHYDINHNNITVRCLDERLSCNTETYEDVLREKVVERVQQGIPVMFSLKYLPDYTPIAAIDHFVLTIGYNEDTDELIYYDMNQTYRSTVTKLTDGSFGYSTINLFGIMNIIEFPDFEPM
ncbi:MAG: carboxypeptidase regulatory-like domain-containing protein [Proteobacteria bacterium]|nr:carboxypeptidase regulatory-like domain-containing protein [Pseudomonadota bacterium]